jgi:hypothetical protein
MNTPRPYARRRNSLEAGSTSALRRSHRATRGFLNRLHLDLTEPNNKVPSKYKEEEKEKEENRNGKKENEKRQEKDDRGHEYEYRHEKRSCLKNIMRMRKDGTAVQGSSTLLESTRRTLKQQSSASLAGSIQVSLRSEIAAYSTLKHHRARSSLRTSLDRT